MDLRSRIIPLQTLFAIRACTSKSLFAPHTQFRLARTMVTYRWKKIQIAERVGHMIGVAVPIHSFFTASAAFCATGGQKLVVLVFALMGFAAIVFHWLVYYVEMCLFLYIRWILINAFFPLFHSLSQIEEYLYPASSHLFCFSSVALYNSPNVFLDNGLISCGG